MRRRRVRRGETRTAGPATLKTRINLFGAQPGAGIIDAFEFPTRGAAMIHFVVHEEGDGVGVVVVEGVKAGQALAGWIMEDDKDVQVTAKSDIPIGHKVALRDYKAGDTVIKYGVDIGKVVKPIAKGEHLHVHNVKTKRW